MEDGSAGITYDTTTKLFDASRDNIRYYAGPVFNADGNKVAVSIGKSLLFFSFPDLQLIACPVDADAATDDMKVIELTAKDPVTGESFAYSMPCGAAIPKGAVCTCNCVKGRGGCSCDSYVKSSGSGSSGGSSGVRHYWHPN